MMSRLLFGLSKISSPTNVLINKSRSLRLLSSSGPYLTLGITGNENAGKDGGFVGDVLLFDPAKESLVTVRDKGAPDELYKSKVIGASHGWVFFSDLSNHKNVFISDLYNPLTPKLTTKIVHPPPLASMYGHTKVVWNVAMSSFPEEEECVVAIKFLWRRGPDLAWTNKQIPFVSNSDSSNIMYSKRDQRFYLLAPGGNYLCSWDLHLDNDPKFTQLVLSKLPQLPQYAWERLSSFYREEHWVESPCGQSFLVQCYVPSIRHKDPILLVFREDHDAAEEGKKKMCHVEDIGDLCIFLSKNNPFCVVASFCPGLKRSSIYLMGRFCALCDLTTGDIRHFELPQVEPDWAPFLPYWLPPFTI